MIVTVQCRVILKRPTLSHVFLSSAVFASLSRNSRFASSNLRLISSYSSGATAPSHPAHAPTRRITAVSGPHRVRISHIRLVGAATPFRSSEWDRVRGVARPRRSDESTPRFVRGYIGQKSLNVRFAVLERAADRVQQLTPTCFCESKRVDKVSCQSCVLYFV
ncbi:hypothetical protein VTO42DRAFT_2350 [Malbranchea cinnamomea]